MMIANPKVTPAHLSRKAVVYVRQSSPKQVVENVESQRLQYALRDRARSMGFQNVEVIDSDLGSSAAVGAKERAGFTRLLGAVALGEVGLILSIEVSRLSRSDKDWCQLLELCQAFGTLIADADQVYDLAAMDDQLVLGIKGTLSVVELKVLRNRLVRGQEEKARRGELFRIVAPGYIRQEETIVKDPDQRVQTAVDLVFTKYRETWSARQTHKWFIDHEVSLPVNRRGNGSSRIAWQLPGMTFVLSMLHNPIYAGAYVWGRKPGRMIVSGGRPVKRPGRRLEPEQCRVFIRDHHEGYITWEEFGENRRRLRSQTLRMGSDASVSVIRQGHGLLSGRLRCGRCGRKLHVRYWGKSGTAARYLCDGDFGNGGTYCIGFGGATVDRRFSELLLDVISPYGIQASLEAVETLNAEVDDQSAVHGRQLEQLEYEARRAFEQYDEADPRNRLVAAELERRWNEKLEELARVKKTFQSLADQRQTLTRDEEQRLRDLGASFREVWESDACPMELKKKIVQTVIEEIVVNLDDATQRLRFVIHWKGGRHTGFEMDKPRSGVGRKTDIADVELIREMADRYEDGEIARVLNKLKRTTGKGHPWSQSRVASVRSKHGIAHAPNLKMRGQEILSLAQAAHHCGVSDTAIRKIVEARVLPMNQIAPWAPWEIRRADLDAEPVCGILDRLRRTGKLDLEGIVSIDQQPLFPENQ
ncbi:MAG TPA: recombinase family protein [Opitutaceae bacterium]